MHAVTQSLVSPLKQTERKRYSAWAAHGGRDALSRCARPGTQRGIIDAVRVGLCILAITPVISLYRLNVGRLYPGYLIWRVVLRAVSAGVALLLLAATKDGLETRSGIFEECGRGAGDRWPAA